MRLAGRTKASVFFSMMLAFCKAIDFAELGISELKNLNPSEPTNMHPAFSVIFLTTLIGAGQGLFLALYTAQLYLQFKILPQQNLEAFYAHGSLIALFFLGSGLFASFFHLGHPERAWRSATKWRTSWLSREVIALPAVIGLIFAYGISHYFGLTDPLFQLPGGAQIDLSLLLGLAATLSTFALFICTGMIYACIKFLQEWASPLTVINFTLLGTASGFHLATALSIWEQTGLSQFYAGWAFIITLLAFLFRWISLLRNRNLRPKSNLTTAIGVKHSEIVQKAQGAMGGSFNTREYFHGKTAFFLRNIRTTFLLLTFVVPLALLGLYLLSPQPTLPLAAFLIQYIGLIAERWYFFADANHPQNLYYQCIS